MRKVLAVLIVALVLVPVTVFADFKTKVQREVQKEIGAFYQRNQGSVITIDNMDGLMLHLNQIFNENIVIPKPVPKPDAPMEEKAGE